MNIWPDFDVAIVGGGPVGLTLAALLDRLGLTSCVYERRPALHRNPQAHVINTRTMEILRELGVEHAVQAAAAPPLLLRWITWCESLAGRELGRISLQGDSPASLVERLALSPTSIANLAQNRLEPFLLELVQRSSRSQVRFSSEVIDVEEVGAAGEVHANGDDRAAREDAALDTCGEHVQLRVRDRDGRESSVTAAFVVACDGSGSSVRRGLGIEMVGPASLQKFVSIYFEANLERWIAGRTGPLFWIAGAKTRGAIIGFDLVRTWALMVPYDEPNTPEDFSPAVVERLVAGAIGDPAAAFRITSVGNWNMSAQIAERYAKGRVFLAGDAAHRFPPSGGLGMNTGIQDAHNLAWKLAAVMHGRAGAALLDSYETERRPVAQINCDQSVRNALRMMEVDMVLGASTLAAVDLAAVMDDAPRCVDFALDGDTDAAVAKRRNLHDVIQSQAEHFDFGGLDLGFRYEAGAVVDDGSEATPLDVRVYTPSARPGSRLPHVWLRRLGRRVSTHDIVRTGHFTLITDPDGSVWVDAARRLVRQGRVELDLAVIGGAAIGDAVIEDAGSAGAVIGDAGGVGNAGEWTDASGGWAAVSGLARGGALLVRPDGHVAWRRADAPTVSIDAFDELAGVFDKLLHNQLATSGNEVAA